MKGFTFLENYYTTISDPENGLSDEEKGQIYKALIEYIFAGTKPEFKGITRAIFSALLPSIDLSKTRSMSRQNGNKTKSKQNQNVNKTESKPNQNRIETESKTNQNVNKTETKPNQRERESPYKELPQTERQERSKEKKEYNPQENTPQEKETDPLTPLGGWSDGQTYEDKAQKEFFTLYPKIRIDNYSPSEYAGIDFELLIRRFEESEFLRGAHSFSFICKNYPKIAAGEYRDFYRRVYFQENKLGSEWDDLK